MDNNYKKIREEKSKQESKDRLSKTLKKKIQTTMIGALSSIEENFGFLWESDNESISVNKQDMKTLYNKLRSEILDKGTNQARNIDAELSQHDIELFRYSIKIPVIPQPKK